MKNFKSGLLVLAACIAAGSTLNGGPADTGKIAAQKVVEQLKAAHPEITGLELAASRSETDGCKTIAATEANEIGQKCDEDELTAIKTNKPFVEKEKDEFDVTLPIHDSTGAIIGTAGMDFKAESDRTQETVVRLAKQIAAELEKRITSKEQLFEPVK